MSKESFLKHVKGKNPNIDIDKLFDIFESKLKEIQIIPGNDLVLPIGCDLNKALVASVISEYIK